MQYKKGLIDTNILVYSIDELSSYHQKAKEFMGYMFGENSAILTPQVMLELYNVLASNAQGRNQIRKIKELIEFYYSNFIEQFIYPFDQTSLTSIRFGASQGKEKRSRIFDYFIAQTALDNGIEVVYTKNIKDFQGLNGIEFIDPLH